ncbi:hypothetical protein CMV_009209 [Castanea mollissima]|uniref:Uncharacterized protein n=1 Tax=Castanea mollissima TaxID=60419 RepID=A0A8J4VYT3_9ROSI|nr:hypothetical protein CMV_009209 [Castanea mollissima]
MLLISFTIQYRKVLLISFTNKSGQPKVLLISSPAETNERLIAEVDQEISNGDIHNEARNSTNDGDADARRGAILRTSIARRMWNDYEPLIEANPNAKKWKRTPIQHYEKLFDLFSKDRATGEGCISAKEKNHILQWSLLPTHVRHRPRRRRKHLKWLEMLEKQMEISQSGIDNVAVSIRQGNEIAKEGLAIMERGHEIAKEGLAIMERGRPHCYSEDEVFSKLVKIGILTDMQLDALLFLIKDPAKMRAFFGVPTSVLRRQILLKMIFKTTDFNEYQTATDLILCTFVCYFNAVFSSIQIKVKGMLCLKLQEKLISEIS